MSLDKCRLTRLHNIAVIVHLCIATNGRLSGFINISEMSGSPTKAALHMATATKWMLASIVGLLGIVLLIAGKSVAGAALVAAGLIVALPFHRLIESKRLQLSLRLALIAVLLIVAIEGIAGTDIVPGQSTTGYKFVDQLSAIFQRFRDNILGREVTREGPPGPHPQGQ